MAEEKIYVTKPFLPPFEEFSQELKKIWDSKVLTNMGPYHATFEQELANYLGVKNLNLFSNATLALMIALKALDIKGEVITTPFSFIATTHAIKWNGIEPVFVDIEPNYFTLDPSKIEAAITEKTTAIMPVHVYGYPCDMAAIQKIADKHNLKVIYDAAHTFGVNVNDASILEHGDVSILSFHATKVFNTFEGGAVVCKDPAIKKAIDYLINFGFEDEEVVMGIGINAKMNEFSAALGITQLKYMPQIIAQRKRLVEQYRAKLNHIPGISFLEDLPHVTHNYGYFPIFIEPPYALTRDELFAKFRADNIYARKYFYPLISQFHPYNTLPSAAATHLPIATEISKKVLCLPLFPDMSNEVLDRIIHIITS